MLKNVIVVAHDPKWAEHFKVESRLIMCALGESALVVHHIGSTAIPTIVAKPVIDMLAVVTDLDLIDLHASKMQHLGYEAMGEFGISGRRYFRKNNTAGTRTHHVHAYAEGNPEIQRHLNFRDFLNAHPQWAVEYSDLKRRLVDENRKVGQNYQDGKSEFIQRIELLAAVWKTSELQHFPPMNSRGS